MCNPLSLSKTWPRIQGGNLNSTRSEELRQRLQSSRVSSALNLTFFVPISEVKRLIEPQVVLSILEELGPLPSSDAELSATIVQAASKLFALLVWVGQTRHVLSLGSQYLDDKNLPLDRNGLVLDKLRSMPGWSKSCEVKILRDQWIFLAPVFLREGQVINNPPYVPLPFISVSSEGKDSAYSSVRQIKIHPSHVEFLGKDDNDAAPNLALKLFKPAGERRFENELRILQILNQRSSPNIVRLIVATTNQKCRCIVFPWAGSDLSELMEKEISPTQRRELVKWIIEQFIGLSEGLAAIHYIPPNHGCPLHLQGRHGDLRPANILKMRDPKSSMQSVNIGTCRLQIASMAMAQLIEAESQFTIPSETGTYQGPECHLQNAVGPLYDIWSLGCIFLEMIIWWFEGPSGLQAFSKDRNVPDPLLGEKVHDDYFFTLRINEGSYVGAEVRSSVLSCMKRLEQDERMESVFRDALRIIKRDMLVPIASQRLEAPVLSMKFRNLAQQLFLEPKGDEIGRKSDE